MCLCPLSTFLREPLTQRKHSGPACCEMLLALALVFDFSMLHVFSETLCCFGNATAAREFQVQAVRSQVWGFPNPNLDLKKIFRFRFRQREAKNTVLENQIMRLQKVVSHESPVFSGFVVRQTRNLKCI